MWLIIIPYGSNSQLGHSKKIIAHPRMTNPYIRRNSQVRFWLWSLCKKTHVPAAPGSTFLTPRFGASETASTDLGDLGRFQQHQSLGAFRTIWYPLARWQGTGDPEVVVVIGNRFGIQAENLKMGKDKYICIYIYIYT